jgi:CRISPR-associated exonuclease Cas4
MEHVSDLVYEGKLIHETSYPQRPEKFVEVEVDGIKIDFYDAKNRVVHEIKKSNKLEDAHVWQLKYYMYVLEQNGISGVSGVLEYPQLRKTMKILLSDMDREHIKELLNKISVVMKNESCPIVERKRYCEKCSYYEFCFVTEEGEE